VAPNMQSPLKESGVSATSGFVFGRYLVRILALAPHILSNIIRGILQTLQPKAGTVLRVDHHRFLPFQSIILQSSYSIYCRVMHPVACIIKVAKINRHSQQLYKIFITFLLLVQSQLQL
jgi:hypothetical protein